MKGPSIKSKGAKLPKPPSTKMGEVAEAPKTKGTSVPTATAPAAVSKKDGDGSKVQVSAETAKMAPSAKGSKKEQGQSVAMPKGDAEDRHY